MHPVFRSPANVVSRRRNIPVQRPNKSRSRHARPTVFRRFSPPFAASPTRPGPPTEVGRTNRFRFVPQSSRGPMRQQTSSCVVGAYTAAMSNTDPASAGTCAPPFPIQHPPWENDARQYPAGSRTEQIPNPGVSQPRHNPRNGANIAIPVHRRNQNSAAHLALLLQANPKMHAAIAAVPSVACKIAYGDPAHIWKPTFSWRRTH